MSARRSAKDENVFGGEWSIKKLDCVENYLRAYLNVLKHQEWADLYYIDAFSGDGMQRFNGSRVGAQDGFSFGDSLMGEFVEGSSMRALKVSADNEMSGRRGFGHFLFLELNENKLKNLRSRIEDTYPQLLPRCQFIPGDVNETLPRIIQSISWEKQRGVVFIDPWATQLSWKSVEAFRGARCDIWMLFPLGAIARMLPKDHMPSKGFEDALARVFGDDGWKNLYRREESVQLSLFGEECERHSRQSGTQELIDYVTTRLKTVFQGVCGPTELRTSTNAPLFALYSMMPMGSKSAIRHFRDISNSLLRSIA